MGKRTGSINNIYFVKMNKVNLIQNGVRKPQRDGSHLSTAQLVETNFTHLSRKRLALHTPSGSRKVFSSSCNNTDNKKPPQP